MMAFSKIRLEFGGIVRRDIVLQAPKIKRKQGSPGARAGPIQPPNMRLTMRAA